MKAEKLYQMLPNFLQGLLISAYNFKEYKKRYGGRYNEYKQQLWKNRNLSLIELKDIQKKKFTAFLHNAISGSEFYKKYPVVELEQITALPILSKEMLRINLEKIYTIHRNEAIHIKTGGTTGKSVEVYFTEDNMQERYAFLDYFRETFGYKLGEKTAWFSGKHLLTNKDVKKNRFWKTDLINKVRYYSTFHLNDHYLKYYVENLIEYKPKFISGFPFAIYEIANFGLRFGYNYPVNTMVAIFTTAETVTPHIRKTIESFFKCRIYDQYASSEGVPFIFECASGNKHLELQSGVYEILDENDMPASSGKLITTSFSTDGTPLIRYDVGDHIELEDEKRTCNCGNNNPMVKNIFGRETDFIYSDETGKVSAANLTNALKGVKGVVRFQIVQNSKEKIDILILKDNDVYDKQDESVFIKNLRDRLGYKMNFNIIYVDNIPVEASGKFRVTKNNIQ